LLFGSPTPPKPWVEKDERVDLSPNKETSQRMSIVY